MSDNQLLTEDEIKKFKRIALKDYGVRLTNKQAFEQGMSLISLFDYLVKRHLKK